MLSLLVLSSLEVVVERYKLIYRCTVQKTLIINLISSCFIFHL